MNWVISNLTQIFSIIGAVYTIVSTLAGVVPAGSKTQGILTAVAFDLDKLLKNIPKPPTPPKGPLLPVLVLTCMLGLGGCGFLQTVAASPVQSVNRVVQQTEILVADATLAFNSALLFVPADKREVLQVKWANSVIVIRKTEGVLTDIARTWEDSRSLPANFPALVGDLVKGAEDLVALVDSVEDLISAPTSSTDAGSEVAVTDSETAETGLKTHALSGVHVQTHNDLSRLRELAAEKI